MTADRPILFSWSGDSMVPANGYHARVCDELFVVGQRYMLAEHHQRSSETHRHYFATLHDLWLNLPERLAAEFPSSEKLRKHGLIRTGYCDSQSIVCSSKREAERMAAFMQPMDEFSVIDVRGSTVTRYVAKSQNMRAMDKKDFQASKEAVLNWIEDLIGLERGAGEKQAA